MHVAPSLLVLASVSLPHGYTGEEGSSDSPGRLGDLPWQCIGPDALLDAVRLGEKVIGVAPAAREKELLADSAAGVVEETHHQSVTHQARAGHPRLGRQVALLVGSEVPLDAPRLALLDCPVAVRVLPATHEAKVFTLLRLAVKPESVPGYAVDDDPGILRRGTTLITSPGMTTDLGLQVCVVPREHVDLLEEVLLRVLHGGQLRLQVAGVGLCLDLMSFSSSSIISHLASCI